MMCHHHCLASQGHGSKAFPHVLQAHWYWDDRRWQGGQHHSETEIVWVKGPSLGMCLSLRACKELLGSGAYRNDLLAQMFVRPTNLQRGQGKEEKTKSPQTEAKKCPRQESGKSTRSLLRAVNRWIWQWDTTVNTGMPTEIPGVDIRGWLGEMLIIYQAHLSS